MLSLELDQASERRLADEANKRGLTPESFAAQLLQEALSARADPASSPVGPSTSTSLDEWERELDRLIEDQDHTIPAIPDEALRRESLYEDRS
jgi:hypothetical protein